MNSSITEVEDWLWAIRDPRVDGWLLVSSIKPMITMLAGYLVMVYAGPIAMKNRKPFDIKWLLIVYNLSIVVLSVYIVAQFLIGVIRLKYNWLCDASNPLATDEETMRIVKTAHLYMLTKPIEWLDTLFFIIRKKNKQMSVLHVYHHSTVFPFAWSFVRFCPSGMTFFAMFLNTFVHVIMYSYYALAAFGPTFQKYLWWKKYLTLFQMAQFSAVILQGIYQISTGCNLTSTFFQYYAVFYISSFLILFALFYRSTYKAKSKQKYEYQTPYNVDNVKGKDELKGQSFLLNKGDLRKRSMMVNF